MELSGAPKHAAELGNILLEAGGAFRVLLVVLAQASASDNRRQLQKLVSDASARFEIATNVSFDVLENFDVVVIGSAHPTSIAWIREFRRHLPDYNRLLWWLHESAAAVGTGDIGVRSVHQQLLDVDALAFETWTGQVFVSVLNPS